MFFFTHIPNCSWNQRWLTQWSNHRRPILRMNLFWEEFSLWESMLVRYRSNGKFCQNVIPRNCRRIQLWLCSSFIINVETTVCPPKFVTRAPVFDFRVLLKRTDQLLRNATPCKVNVLKSKWEITEYCLSVFLLFFLKLLAEQNRFGSRHSSVQRIKIGIDEWIFCCSRSTGHGKVLCWRADLEASARQREQLQRRRTASYFDCVSNKSCSRRICWRFVGLFS